MRISRAGASLGGANLALLSQQLRTVKIISLAARRLCRLRRTVAIVAAKKLTDCSTVGVTQATQVPGQSLSQVM